MIDRLTPEDATRICEIFDLDPDHLQSLVITPQAVFVTTYRRNANGHKYIDGLTSQIALDYAVVPGPFPAPSVDEGRDRP